MCTRVLWNTNEMGVLNGRTMDWPYSTQPKLMVFPAGLYHNGGKYRGKNIVSGELLEWTSRYKSIGITAFDIGSVDGFNEKGFAIHMLFFTDTEYGDRELDKSGVQVGLLGQYLLDRASSVSGALNLLKQIQPVMITIQIGKDEFKGTMHLAIEDEAGASAILEYLDGNLIIHYGRKYQILTNHPSCDEMFSILMNVSIPFNAPHKEVGAIYDTEYRTVTDLKDKKYFFELTTVPYLNWVDLMDCNVSPNSVLKLDLYDSGLIGDVAAKLKEVPAPFFKHEKLSGRKRK